MITTEAFDRLVVQIKELLPNVLKAKGIDINDLNSSYGGPTVCIHSNDFIHLLNGNGQTNADNLMDIGCALLNIGYENFCFSLESGNTKDGYLYHICIHYTTDDE